ncbi:MAG: hypothetical protein NUK54_01235, partial [Methanothrix sp.]|nr:hypothetical protein [Methanothrix sp.]
VAFPDPLPLVHGGHVQFDLFCHFYNSFILGYNQKKNDFKICMEVGKRAKGANRSSPTNVARP